MTLGEIMGRSGALKWGVARVGDVEKEWTDGYGNWIAQGCNAAMDYLERNGDVRNNPARLLDGAKSIVCGAFPYFHKEALKNKAFSAYAQGDDYHEVLRTRLQTAAEELREAKGGETRVCVDTAPLRERYWAVKCGVGGIGRNGHLIVPGAGSFFFLGFILTTAELEPSVPTAANPCTGCGECVSCCPTGALRGDGTVDARRCLSYLTVEHRGELPGGCDLHGQIYGCDVCGAVCPLNSEPPCGLPEFAPRTEVLDLGVEDVLEMTLEDFSALFRHSAVKRTKLAGLRRNAANVRVRGCGGES